jgi:type IV secretory pathway VirB10-like protein
MSIIQDALKKAQNDRAKKNKREVPYHLSGVQEKSKAVIIYVAAGLFVAAVFAYLYIPYFHKPKQIAQSVPIQPAVPVKPVQAAIIEKPVVPVIPKNKQEPAITKVRIAQVQITAISPPVERKTKAVESTGRQDIMNEPVRAVEKRTDDGSIDTTYNEALREQQSGRTREAKTIYRGYSNTGKTMPRHIITSALLPCGMETASSRKNICEKPYRLNPMIRALM